MKTFKFGIFALVVAFMGTLGVANATPASTVGASDTLMEALTVNEDLVKVYGCHKNTKKHMVYKWGYKTWHHHGYNCQPKKHVKKKKWKNCHSNMKKHWHKGWGTKWHRHVGQGCHYSKGKVYKKHHYNNNHGHYNNHHYKNNNCIKIGPLVVCQ